ncbi:hypothetical protein MKY29_05825 [Psychrobacillus sp. FSL K6-2365]|uniref:hypothetical protein n=1 Tax=Psychrobacillus TaxID=1221880 RepID=UPI0008E28A11|nr:hypothetical protein [Psychrobacillus psychrodurans]MCZ8539316.1 hypothetical protein [Psychrobacillus psychrodurans]SFM36306.1 hypothetical protein SAMN05421832_102149 [Psychrobacillus psychrodurans]
MNAFNDPLIFIKGPPVFHLPPKERFEAPYELLDESTSIYEIQKSYSTKTLAIIDKLKFLAKPFQRKVYRPLIFHLKDGVSVQGEVEKVEEDTVILLVGAEELLTYPVEEIERIVWRGSILN